MKTQWTSVTYFDISLQLVGGTVYQFSKLASIKVKLTIDGVNASDPQVKLVRWWQYGHRSVVCLAVEKCAGQLKS